MKVFNTNIINDFKNIKLDGLDLFLSIFKHVEFVDYLKYTLINNNNKKNIYINLDACNVPKFLQTMQKYLNISHEKDMIEYIKNPFSSSKAGGEIFILTIGIFILRSVSETKLNLNIVMLPKIIERWINLYIEIKYDKIISSNITSIDMYTKSKNDFKKRTKSLIHTLLKPDRLNVLYKMFILILNSNVYVGNDKNSNVATIINLISTNSDANMIFNYMNNKIDENLTDIDEFSVLYLNNTNQMITKKIKKNPYAEEKKNNPPSVHFDQGMVIIKFDDGKSYENKGITGIFVEYCSKIPIFNYKNNNGVTKQLDWYDVISFYFIYLTYDIGRKYYIQPELNKYTKLLMDKNLDIPMGASIEKLKDISDKIIINNEKVIIYKVSKNSNLLTVYPTAAGGLDQFLKDYNTIFLKIVFNKDFNHMIKPILRWQSTDVEDSEITTEAEDLTIETEITTEVEDSEITTEAEDLPIETEAEVQQQKEQDQQEQQQQEQKEHQQREQERQQKEQERQEQQQKEQEHSIHTKPWSKKKNYTYPMLLLFVYFIVQYNLPEDWIVKLYPNHSSIINNTINTSNITQQEILENLFKNNNPVPESLIEAVIFDHRKIDPDKYQGFKRELDKLKQEARKRLRLDGVECKFDFLPNPEMVYNFYSYYLVDSNLDGYIDMFKKANIYDEAIDRFGITFPFDASVNNINNASVIISTSTGPYKYNLRDDEDLGTKTFDWDWDWAESTDYLTTIFATSAGVVGAFVSSRMEQV